MIGVNSEQDLDKIPPLLAGREYVYYEKYNEDMPYRRFFVKLKENPSKWLFPEQINKDDEIPEKLHDHSLKVGTYTCNTYRFRTLLRHIAFRDYLKNVSRCKNEVSETKRRAWKKNGKMVMSTMKLK